MRVRVIIWLFLFSVGFWSVSQTKISMPPAKMSFEELAKTTPKNRKQLKKDDRLRNKKWKEVKKKLQKNTNLKKREIDRYSVMIKGLDSAELESFDDRLTDVITSQDISKGKRLSKTRQVKLDKKQWQAYKKSLEKGKLSFGDSLHDDTIHFQVKDIPLLDSLVVPDELPNGFRFTIPDTLQDIDVSSSRIDSSFSWQENDVEAFLESFAKQRAMKQGLLLPESRTPTTQVKNFIPDLEKLNYEKPKISEKQLSEAILDQQKERRKEELKRSFLDTPNDSDQKQRKVNWVDRWQIGGFIEYKPEKRLIELTPTLTYGLGKKFLIGVGYSTVIPLQNDDEIEKQIAYRAFADYIFYRSFFLHLESEWKERRQAEAATVKEQNTYLGLGRIFTFKKISTNILWLYNLSAPNEIETRRFSVRFAINFNP